jgi:hypothetical protein
MAILRGAADCRFARESGQRNRLDRPVKHCCFAARSLPGKAAVAAEAVADALATPDAQADRAYRECADRDCVPTIPLR